MSSGKNYIPSALADFIPWQGNLVTKVGTNATEWNISTAKVTALTDAQGVYLPLYEKVANPATKTKGAVKAQEDGRKEYEKFIRAFVKENLINNSAITAEQKINMGLNPGNSSHSARPKITTAPFVLLSSLGNLQIKLTFRTEDDESRPSIQPDSDGVEMRVLIASEPPKNSSELKDVLFSTKARFTHILNDPTFAGQTLYVVARWKNNSDPAKSGPWSGIASVLIG
jgi:hypothetical protein